MTLGLVPAIAVPLAHLVPLRFDVVGQAWALCLLACPIVPAKNAPRLCERSADLYALLRARVFFDFLLYTRKEKTDGTMGQSPEFRRSQASHSNF